MHINGHYPNSGWFVISLMSVILALIALNV